MAMVEGNIPDVNDARNLRVMAEPAARAGV